MGSFFVAALAIELSTKADAKQTPNWRFVGENICNPNRNALGTELEENTTTRGTLRTLENQFEAGATLI
jgi:hypothetical protein